MPVPPFILIADDGAHWYKSTSAMGRDLESPDVNAGIYRAFDSNGLLLDLVCPPSSRGSFVVDVKPVDVRATDKTDAPALRTALMAHMDQAHGMSLGKDTPLELLVSLLLEKQASDG